MARTAFKKAMVKWARKTREKEGARVEELRRLWLARRSARPYVSHDRDPFVASMIEKREQALAEFAFDKIRRDLDAIRR